MKAEEKKDVVITVSSNEFEELKHVESMLMKIYLVMSDGDIEKRAHEAACFINDMLLFKTIVDDESKQEVNE